ncbi:T9SS type A sorting domain-containing protein [Chitinophaga sancti]|uniref:T9SS type A sorting domain-containing protein n=1 Tax=Chitinophaga sancti TaxID=1004 RepID=UPI003F7B0A03
MYKCYLLLILSLISTLCMHAQVSVNASIGLPDSTYSTLKRAFDAINAGTHQGVINISITGSTTETSTAKLNASGGTSNYVTIKIRPTVVCSLRGNLPSAMIDLNGADSVIIDGRIHDSDTVRSLTITNIHSSLTVRSSTIRFINGAQGNTIRYCNIEGSGQTKESGNIVLGETAVNTTLKNAYNVIDHNDIRPANNRGMLYGILGRFILQNLGYNYYNTFSNNLVHGFYNYNTANIDIPFTAGIYLTYHEGFITVSGNSIYQTDTINQSQYFMYVEPTANWNINKDNYIGGSAAQAGGHPAYYSGDNISITGLYDGSNSNRNRGQVDGNVVTNFELLSSTGSVGFTGMVFSRTNDLIGESKKNIVGSVTDTGVIRVECPGCTTMNITGVLLSNLSLGSQSALRLKNMEVGGISADAPLANAQVKGISKDVGTDSVLIEHCVVRQFAIRADSGAVAGIALIHNNYQQVFCRNNTVSDLSSNVNINGIYAFRLNSAGAFTANNIIEDNQVYGLYNNNGAVNGSVRGIFSDNVIGTGSASAYMNNTIRRNHVYDLYTTSINTAAIVTGIENTNTYYQYFYVDTNTIHSLHNPAAYSGTQYSPAVQGISARGPRNAPVRIQGNMIYDLENTATPVAYVAGITCLHSGNTNVLQVLKNRIYDLRTPLASSGNVSGVLLNGASGAGSFTVQNNMIRLEPAKTEVYGINLLQISTAVTAYFNSISIGGTATGTNISAAFRKSRFTGTTVTSVNNIYYNTRTGGTGKHYALVNERPNPAQEWILSDYNDLYSANPATVGLWYNKPLSFADFKDSSNMDAHSISVPVSFVDTTTADLHLLSGNNALVAGTSSTPVTDDYDGDERHPVPTIGADELEVMMALMKNEAKTTIAIYPNPAHDYLTVNIADNALLSIYDAQGKKIQDKKAVSKTVVDVQKLVPGMYLLIIRSSSGISAQWFIKQ